MDKIVVPDVLQGITNIKTGCGTPRRSKGIRSPFMHFTARNAVCDISVLAVLRWFTTACRVLSVCTPRSHGQRLQPAGQLAGADCWRLLAHGQLDTSPPGFQNHDWHTECNICGTMGPHATRSVLPWLKTLVYMQ